MSDADYAEASRELRESLYLLACTQRTAPAGEGQAQNSLKAAIKSYKGSPAPYSQLARVCENFEQKREAFSGESAQYGDKSAPDLWAILHTMDAQFCSSTEAAARRAWEAAFKKKTLSNGVMPDQALIDTYKLCKQRYPLGTAKEEALYLFHENIEAQVKHFDAPTCLYELEKLVKSDMFVDLSVDDMVKRLEIFFSADTQGQKVSGYLHQKGPKAAAGPDEKLLKRVNALEAQVKAVPPVAPPAAPLAGAPAQLPVAIHAVGGAYSSGSGAYSGRMDDAWVAREGAVGFPAPIARGKPSLYVAKIWAHMGLPLSSTFPETSKEKVGPDCPGCKIGRPNIPVSGWYYHQDDALFSTVGGGRVRPVVGKYQDGGAKYEANTSFFHNAAYCMNVYAVVHRWVRAHPEDKWMFDGVPQGENAYARPAGH